MGSTQEIRVRKGVMARYIALALNAGIPTPEIKGANPAPFTPHVTEIFQR